MYISEEGLTKVKARLQELKTKKRQEIAERLEHSKSLGDLSENAEYHEAKEEQSLIETEIAELEETIRNAVLIEKDQGTDIVRVGTTVEVSSLRGKETYTIVGSEEANPLEGKISNESPIGKALLRHKAGDTVDIKTPGGVVTYTIGAIR